MTPTQASPQAITLTLSDFHIRKMIENHLLQEADMRDNAKVSQIAQQLLDEALGLPEQHWHAWDDWAKGLE